MRSSGGLPSQASPGPEVKNKAVLQARRATFESRAWQAEYAAAFGNMSRLYNMASAMGGKKIKPHAGINDEEGRLLTDKPKLDERWVRHYSKVLCADPSTPIPPQCPAGQTATDWCQITIHLGEGAQGHLSPEPAQGDWSG